MASQQPQLTELAKRFGVSTIPKIGDQGKSGLTPIDYPTTDYIPTPEQKEIEDNDQSLRLHGFTTRELQSAGCITKANIQRCDLPSGLHPIFERRSWIKDGEPMADGSRGTINAWNDRVWDAMRPSLQMISKILEMTEMWVWFDALSKGPRTVIPATAIEDGGPERPLYFFSPRKPYEIKADPASGSDYLTGLATVVKCGIKHFPVLSALTERRTIQTRNNQIEITIWLNTKHISRLLDKRTPTYEKVLEQMFLTNLLLHETCHALIFYIQTNTNHSRPRDEGFYCNEAIAEFGHSVENAVWGGSIRERQYDTPGTEQVQPPLLVSFLINWPNYRSFRDGKYDPKKSHRYRFHDSFKAAAEPKLFFWPIQIHWAEALQLDDFWLAHYATKKDIRPPKVIAAEWMKNKDDDFRGVYIRKSIGSSYGDWLKSPDCPAVPPIPNIPRDATEYEVALSTQHQALYNSIQSQLKENFDSMQHNIQ